MTRLLRSVLALGAGRLGRHLGCRPPHQGWSMQDAARRGRCADRGSSRCPDGGPVSRPSLPSCRRPPPYAAGSCTGMLAKSSSATWWSTQGRGRGRLCRPQQRTSPVLAKLRFYCVLTPHSRWHAGHPAGHPGEHERHRLQLSEPVQRCAPGQRPRSQLLCPGREHPKRHRVGPNGKFISPA
jgi:hypothetical protein